MARGTGPEEQPGGLRLRAELARGPEGPRARLLAGPVALAPGLRLVSLVAEPLGQVLGAEIRRLRSRATDLRVEVEAPALEGLAQALVGAEIAGWRVGRVELELVGEALVVALSGPGEGGWPGLVQVELAAAPEGRGIALRPGRAWCLAPLRATPEALCRRLAARVAARCPGVVVLRSPGQGRGARSEGTGVWIDPAAGLRRAFVVAGGRPPELHGLALARLRGEGRGLRMHWTPWRGERGEARAEGRIEDPWRGLRERLAAGDREGALAELERCAPGPATPGARRLARALAQVRANAWRFVDPVREAAALRAWIAAAPEDPEAWWRVTMLRARAGDLGGVERGLAALERQAAGAAGALRGRAARSIVQARMGGAGRAIVAGLEDMVKQAGPAGALAAGWRALALVRAVDPGVPAAEVRGAIAQAIAVEGGEARAWCSAAELEARAEAAARSVGRRWGEDEPRSRRGRRREAGSSPGGRAGKVGRIGAEPGRAEARREDGAEDRSGEAAGRAEVRREDGAEDRSGEAGRAGVRREDGAEDSRAEVRRADDAEAGRAEGTESAEAAGRAEVRGEDDAEAGRAEGPERAEEVGRAEVRGEDGPEDRSGEVLAEAGREERGGEDGAEDRGDGEDRREGGAEDRGDGEDRGEDGAEDRGDGEDRREEGAEVRAGSSGEVSWAELVAAGEVALVDGEIERVDAVLGDAARARASRPEGPSLTEGPAALVVWGRVFERTGERERGRGWSQVAAFMAQGSGLARALAGALFVPPRVPAPEGFAALAAVLAERVEASAGIRAAEVRREARADPGPEGEAARAWAEAEVEPWRARPGPRLPVIAARRGPPGGVGIRNEHEPTIVVAPALLGLPAAERRFRLALATTLIRQGLALLFDPRGASLPELLAALRCVADPEGTPTSPGAAAIVRVWRRRGARDCVGDAALREELERWTPRPEALAVQLRRHALAAALARSGSLTGALWTVGRDARAIVGEDAAALDAEAAARALAGEEARWLLRATGLLSPEDG